MIARSAGSFFKGAMAAAIAARSAKWKLRCDTYVSGADPEGLQIFLGLVKTSQLESVAWWQRTRKVDEDVAVGICCKRAAVGDEFEFTANVARRTLHYCATLSKPDRTVLEGLTQLEGDLEWAADGEWAPIVMMSHPCTVRVIACSQ